MCLKITTSQRERFIILDDNVSCVGSVSQNNYLSKREVYFKDLELLEADGLVSK